MMLPRTLLVLLAVVGCVTTTRAQQTRTEALERARADKARTLRPYKPAKLEAALLTIEEKRILERLTTADGFYPRLGGLSTGSGFAGGPGFRRHMFADMGIFRASGAISTRGYKLVEAEFLYPHLLNDRLAVGAHARYREFPQEDFFGIGNHSSRRDRTSYLLKDTDFTATVAVRPRPWLSAGVRVGHLSVDLGPGTDPRFPSIEQRFEESSAPGLLRQPDFLHTDLFVDADYRDQPGNARSGGHYRLSFGNYNDQDFNRYSFSRVQGEVTQVFPIFDKKRVIAVRGRLMFADPDPNNILPFYMLPTLGGSDTIRGFREFRFRDENALLLNVEYRWEAFAGLDMALFADAGKVARQRRELDLRGLKTSYGIGFRFNTYKRVFLRIDVAVGGREGMRYFLKFGPAF